MEQRLKEDWPAWLSQITKSDLSSEQAAKARWDSLAKPLGSLGLLEEAVCRIAGLTGSPDVSLKKRSLLVLCADNGVTAQGVTQTDSFVTAAVACALGRNESTVSRMAQSAACQVIPVDMGIRDFTGCAGVRDHRIRNGTADITRGPAMTRKECLKAVETGCALVSSLKEEGVQIIAAGEMGIGNTTTASAVTAVLTDTDPALLTGRGAGLTDEGLKRKLQAVQTAIYLNHPDPSDPVDVLSKVGGLDLAGLCGVFLGGALYRIPVIIDGVISGAAALCAKRMCPSSGCAMLASHVSPEPAGQLLLKELELSPVITAGIRLGEGGGAVALLPLLDMALAVYDSGQTFDKLGIDPYTPQS